MTSFLVGLTLIGAGALLLWLAFVNMFGYLFVVLGIGDRYKSSSANFNVAWYFSYLPVPLIFSGIAVLVLG